MESNVMKTPRRTRRTSIQESHESPLGPAETEEFHALSNRKDPITPSRSARTLDNRTPIRSNSLSAAQTPRRSCRKSMRPIQEYENIVAQKGLSVKRLATIDPTPSVEEVEGATSTSEVRESKWTPADIGRVSTKRTKKKRNKNKRLERQAKLVVEEDQIDELKDLGRDELNDKLGKDLDHNDKSDEDLDHNELNDNKTEEKLIKIEENTFNKEEQNIVNKEEENTFNKEEENTVNKEEENTVNKEEENTFNKEEENIVNMEVENTVNKEEENTVNKEEENTFNKEEKNTVNKEEENENITTLPTIATAIGGIQNEKNNTYESDDSMEEEGDVILNAMPITADDCGHSPEKPLDQDPKTFLSATPIPESVNKSNDSDCIMLSLNDSSQSRQSIDPKPSVARESKFDANESSDSIATNMPPLLVCSDDDDEEEFIDALKSPEVANLESPIDTEHFESNDSNPLNGTFNTKENLEQQTIDSVMGPEEIRKIVLGIEDKPVDAILSASDDDKVSPFNSTFDADDSPKILLDTPKSIITRPSINRNLTPFKTDKPILPDIVIELEEEFEEPSKFVYELKESNLKSSRKRSFSFCVERPKKNVTFKSPVNTTKNIGHGDSNKIAVKRTPTNITKRRKRSLSVTETERDLMEYIQMKKPINDDATPKRKMVHQSKIKMPNFSNIHQKQFQRMESISDHVARRAERAKILINSSTKVKPASVQKGLPLKNSILREHNKDGTKTQLPMPKARHRIDMSELENKNKTNLTNSIHTETISRSKSKQDLRLLDDLISVGKTPTKVNTNSSSLSKQNNGNKVPKQRFNFNFNNSTTVPKCGNTTVTSVPQRMHLPNPRENFNLSTIITTTTRQAPKVDKLEDRRKRMMEMFKSKSSQRTAESKREILKGVRTNRRFELQMMCRNRQN